MSTAPVQPLTAHGLSLRGAMGAFMQLNNRAFRTDTDVGVRIAVANTSSMLCKNYIEALLVDADVADAVWLLWSCGLLSTLDADEIWIKVGAGRYERRVPVSHKYLKFVKPIISFD